MRRLVAGGGENFVAESERAGLNVICLASYFKGVDFIRECKRQGCGVILVTREKNAGEDWPRESIDELLTVPNNAGVDQFVHLVTQVARRVEVGQVFALEEYDVITAGLIREHLQLPGTNSAEARLFRDKLAMRVLAQNAGMLVPEFVHVLNYDALRGFMARVEPPWVLKPRSDVSAVGIKKLSEPEQVWRTIDALDAIPELHQQSSYYLLEQFVPGEVFHVDSLVDDGEVVFAGASCYGRPPMEVAHEGGAFISFTVEHDSTDETTLFELNRQVLKTLGLKRGAAHAEFIKSEADGRFYFLEVASRVGGAYIAETLEAASGVNLWREWARIELAPPAMVHTGSSRRVDCTAASSFRSRDKNFPTRQRTPSLKSSIASGNDFTPVWSSVHRNLRGSNSCSNSLHGGSPMISSRSRHRSKDRTKFANAAGIKIIMKTE